jgi:hypothetical protein
MRSRSPSIGVEADASDCTMSNPTTAGAPALMRSTSFAITDRGHGQRPSFSRLSSSIATITTSGAAGCGPRSMRRKSTARVSRRASGAQPMNRMTESTTPRAIAILSGVRRDRRIRLILANRGAAL